MKLIIEGESPEDLAAVLDLLHGHGKQEAAALLALAAQLGEATATLAAVLPPPSTA